MKKIGVDRQGRPIYETKDGNGGDTNVTQTEVFEQVTKEIKALGDNQKKSVDDMQRELKALRAELDKSGEKADALVREKVERLTEAIATRQEALEKDSKSVKDSMEALELAIKRMGKAGGMGKPDGEKTLEEGAIALKTMKLIVSGQLKSDTEVSVDEADIKAYEDYKRAFPQYIRGFDERNVVGVDKKMLNVGSDPDGGVLVTPVMSARIIQRVFEDDPIRQLASVETIGTDMFEMLVDDDEAGDGWATETTANNETGTPRFHKISIPVHYQEARPRATQKLLDDGSINVENWLADKIAKKFGRTEGAAFVSGTGVGRPRGFLTYPNWTTAGTYEFGKVEQIAMGAAANLTTDGLIDVLFSLIEPYMSRATWLMNRLTVRDTMKLKDGDGQYIWRPGLQQGQPSILLGLAVRMATTMPVVAAGALSVALADFREAYTIVDRQGITTLRDPYTVKPLVEFFTRKRTGGAVTNFQAIKLGVVSV